ncbi:pyruvate, phosphate dikinase [bacterium]|nr:pyruvate, phosphate dikinase [bacterium]
MKQLDGEWRLAIELLERTNQVLYYRIARKLLILLCRAGNAEALELLHLLGTDQASSDVDGYDNENQPRVREKTIDIATISNSIFLLAANNLPNAEILRHMQDSMQQDRAGFLLKAVSDPAADLAEVISAVRRYVQLSPKTIDLPDFTKKSIRVALIRRIFSDDLNYIRIAKEYVNLYDFHNLLSRLVHPAGSRGRLGGKSAGLFLAESILTKYCDTHSNLAAIRVPKTWYIASDAQTGFVHYNNLEEVVEQKYKDVSQVRQEYPHIIQLFKNSQFPLEMIQGLSMALDDFGDKPLVVRSSSLLEDRFGAAFSGKYKSLFLANQGSKPERLNALMDAIAEVYSSTFGPDPIEYRIERGLVDFHEEMSVMIQEVVGTRVGKYYLPSWAGVAFSNNEFRWSPRIRREDGLIRIVPGLGTRAVDRLSDDYPVLAAPGQPSLRVNVSVDEIVRYSPSKIDVINLEKNSFETMDLRQFLEECGNELPGVENMVSIIDDDRIRKPSLIGIDFMTDASVATFRSLFENTPFLDQLHTILKTLENTMQTPVDIEFASDGEHLYLLQCRPQSATLESVPEVIPHDLPNSAVLFTANKYVSNGVVPDLTHIVYVDPTGYASLESLTALRDVGRAIGELNKMLPKRQFILMGPGRWGSRGDIKLGVSVTYSDINNTAVLTEIARRTGKYTPDLSFGTHFFQDLVEAGIRYLPLYPDEEGITFNEELLLSSKNELPDLLPKYRQLEHVVRVIDVRAATGGKVLKVLMNAELNEAVGLFSHPSGSQARRHPAGAPQVSYEKFNHWGWRRDMAERIAQNISPSAFGVKAMYLAGSSKESTAGPTSKIELIIRFAGSDEQKKSLEQWLNGWSLCLEEVNFQKTGYRGGGMLDVHLISDEDLERQSELAVELEAITDSAQELPLGKR